MKDNQCRLAGVRGVQALILSEMAAAIFLNSGCLNPAIPASDVLAVITYRGQHTAFGMKCSRAADTASGR